MSTFTKSEIKNKISELTEKGLFPDGIEESSSEVVINLCKEVRWEINDNGDTPEQLKSKDIKTSIQSLARIDYLKDEIDKNFHIEHVWSNLLTHVDLIKILNENEEIRLRYELHKKGEILVKWIFVNRVVGDDMVVVKVASDKNEINSFERHFEAINTEVETISLKHLKYFLLDAKSKQIEDYQYTEFDGSRFGIRLGKNEFYKPKEFVGVFVQDRFSFTPQQSDNESSDMQETMRLIDSRLCGSFDKMSLIQDLSLVNHGLRVELETQYDEGGIFKRNKAIPEISNNFKHVLSQSNLGKILKVTSNEAI